MFGLLQRSGATDFAITVMGVDTSALGIGFCNYEGSYKYYGNILNVPEHDDAGQRQLMKKAI